MWRIAFSFPRKNTPLYTKSCSQSLQHPDSLFSLSLVDSSSQATVHDPQTFECHSAVSVSDLWKQNIPWWCEHGANWFSMDCRGTMDSNENGLTTLDCPQLWLFAWATHSRAENHHLRRHCHCKRASEYDIMFLHWGVPQDN